MFSVFVYLLHLGMSIWHNSSLQRWITLFHLFYEYEFPYATASYVGESSFGFLQSLWEGGQCLCVLCKFAYTFVGEGYPQ
jgi:hypothetical protein